MDAFLYEVFDEEREAIERYLPADIAVEMTPATPQERGDAAPPASILSTRTQSILPPEWAGDLTALLTRSTGYDHIVRYVRDTNFTGACGYLPLYCARAVAEQACTLWMALLRKLPQQRANFAAFHRDGLTGREAFEKTLLVVGVGNIGREIMQIGKGLGMRVLGVDIDPRHDDVDYVSIDIGLPQADIIACAMNLTADNMGYFNTDRFAAVKPGAVFVNPARGELSPIVDLLAALNNGQLAGVGLDVYEEESKLAVALRENNSTGETPVVQATLELAKHPRAILTPHNAFNTSEAVERKSQQTAESITTFLQSNTFPHPIPLGNDA